MLHKQDRYFSGIITGEECLVQEQFECCVREGLLSLVWNVDPTLEEVFRKVKHQAVAGELAHQRIVQQVLGELGTSGIDCLVFKGTALAYSLYRKPWHRSRSDTDLWVREGDIDATISVLMRLAFEQQVSLPGRIAFGECAFDRIDEFGVKHTIDLHWRLNNSWLLAQAADFEEMWQERQPVPSLGDHAWTCSNTSALLIACVHRIAHLNEVAYELDGFIRFESDFTLWLYDIHLLSESLSESDWLRWSEEVIERRFAEFAISGLDRSSQLFGTRIPSGLMSELKGAPGQIFIRSLENQLSAEWQSFLALGTRRKIGFLMQQLFPDPSYMRQRYGEGSQAMAYLKRLMAGLVKRVR